MNLKPLLLLFALALQSWAHADEAPPVALRPILGIPGVALGAPFNSIPYCPIDDPRTLPCRRRPNAELQRIFPEGEAMLRSISPEGEYRSVASPLGNIGVHTSTEIDTTASAQQDLDKLYDFDFQGQEQTDEHRFITAIVITGYFTVADFGRAYGRPNTSAAFKGHAADGWQDLSGNRLVVVDQPCTPPDGFADIDLPGFHQDPPCSGKHVAFYILGPGNRQKALDELRQSLRASTQGLLGLEANP